MTSMDLSTVFANDVVVNAITINVAALPSAQQKVFSDGLYNTFECDVDNKPRMIVITDNGMTVQFEDLFLKDHLFEHVFQGSMEYHVTYMGIMLDRHIDIPAPPASIEIRLPDDTMLTINCADWYGVEMLHDVLGQNFCICDNEDLEMSVKDLIAKYSV